MHVNFVVVQGLMLMAKPPKDRWLAKPGVASQPAVANSTISMIVAPSLGECCERAKKRDRCSVEVIIVMFVVHPLMQSRTSSSNIDRCPPHSLNFAEWQAT